MSIRNQYARNYFKVAPLPATPNDLTNARNAIKRRNLYQTSLENANMKQTPNHYSNLPVRQPWNVSQPKPTPIRHYYNYDRGVSNDSSDGITGTQVYTHNDKLGRKKYGGLSEKTRLKVIAAQESRRNSLTFVADPKGNKRSNSNLQTSSNCELDILQIRGSNGDDESNDDDDDNNQPDNDVTDDDSDVRHHRPMSARPESRWMRREGDENDRSDASNESVNNSLDTNLTDSPRMNESFRDSSEEMTQEVTSLKSRPKTGRGRMNYTDQMPSKNNHNDTSKSLYDRPKSRIGPRGIPKWTGSSSQTKQTRKPDPENVPYNPYIPFDYVRSHTDNDEIDYNVGINVFYPEVRNNIHEVDDINSKIEDIDKNVDPVLFFMQNDDPLPTRVEKKRPSLSRETINHINKDRITVQNQNKNLYGYHSNNQNKCHSAPEKIDRFHRNKTPGSQNAIPGTNPRYVTNLRHDKNVNVSNEKGGKFTNTTARSNMTFTTDYKRVDYDTGKRYNRENETIKQRRRIDIEDPKTRAFIYGRKPRKLQPLLADE
ncbi:hypothetical protein ACF0H5_011420 [Mactra antiquata]